MSFSPHRWLAVLSLTCALCLTACSEEDGGPKDGGGEGACPATCGPNASCPAGACVCASGWKDCNGDVGKSGGDGCECSHDCNGTQCSVPQTCEPTSLNACGNKTMYCKVDTCTACPSGTYNCDGVQDCESSTACAATECEAYGSKSCGSQSKYCDKGTCKACPDKTYNCNQAGGDCECTTGCEGTSCKDECASETGCGDVTKFCDFGKCAPCPGGTFDCNNKGDCECTVGCDGTKCKGTTSCDYYDQNVCGGDTSKWCNSAKCVSCTGGFFNCNSTKGCECDSAGCNGSQCAGNCLGGECP